jgi:hypothetical protein
MCRGIRTTNFTALTRKSLDLQSFLHSTLSKYTTLNTKEPTFKLLEHYDTQLLALLLRIQQLKEIRDHFYLPIMHWSGKEYIPIKISILELHIIRHPCIFTTCNIQ